MTTWLLNKNCMSCQSTPLQPEAISQLLKELKEDWKVNDSGHLYKKYKFSNFIKAIHFANYITGIAEKEKHHPDLTISWGMCNVEIFTHKANGLTENDFILAAKIDYGVPRSAMVIG